MAEQAEDAAALLCALDLGPAVVVGHSGGASVACSLVVAHPEVMRHAVIYEAPLFAVVPGGPELVAGAGRRPSGPWPRAGRAGPWRVHAERCGR